MAYHSERWSRGCGTGIGLSGHTNQYRQEVLIENWVEDSHAKAGHLAGERLVGGPPGTKFAASTTTGTSYTADGKVGSDLVEVSYRHDIENHQKGVDAPFMFHHGLTGQAPADCNATLNSLAYADPEAGPKQKVHQVLWSGSKFNDAYVPKEGNRVAGAGFAKAKAESEMRGTSRYITHSREMAEQTAFMAVGEKTKADLILPKAMGGQEAQIGRKAKGPCASFFDATYQKIGLRK